MIAALFALALAADSLPREPAQQPVNESVYAKGFEALRGQRVVDLRVSLADDVSAVLPAASIEADVSAQLHRAGMSVFNWTSPESLRPGLWIWIDGSADAGRHHLQGVHGILRAAACPAPRLSTS